MSLPKVSRHLVALKILNFEGTRLFGDIVAAGTETGRKWRELEEGVDDDGNPILHSGRAKKGPTYRLTCHHQLGCLYGFPLGELNEFVEDKLADLNKIIGDGSLSHLSAGRQGTSRLTPYWERTPGRASLQWTPAPASLQWTPAPASLQSTPGRPSAFDLDDLNLDSSFSPSTEPPVKRPNTKRTPSPANG